MKLKRHLFKIVSLIVTLSAVATTSAADPAESLPRKPVPSSSQMSPRPPRVQLSATSVGAGSGIEFSTRPSDTYFPVVQPTPTDGAIQWAPDLLKLPAAWDKVRGRGYVAIIDNGIQTGHPDLQANFKPQLSHNLAAGTSGLIEEGTGSPYAQNPQGQCEQVPQRGHGTHVAGIIGASANDQGVAGTCWNCSLMVYLLSQTFKSTCGMAVPSDPFMASFTSAPNSIIHASFAGAQVINLSAGDRYGVGGFNHAPVQQCLAGIFCDDSLGPLYPEYLVRYAEALRRASELDVVLVAAVGNEQGTTNFPADQPGVIAAGGSRRDMTAWYDPSQPIGSFGSNAGATLAAPAEGVWSTFYKGAFWTPSCWDASAASELPQPWNIGGYGPCTGTSMSTPFISGVAAMVRGANPLLSRTRVKEILTATAQPCGGSQASICGAGVVNAQAAVQAALDEGGPSTRQGQAINRLTPLFSFYGPAQTDHFYTSIPQMAFAAAYGTLQPQGSGGGQYQAIGNSVPGYPNLPHLREWSGLTPRAQFSVFTSHLNPFSSTELAPLYRVSWRCPANLFELNGVYRNRPICSTNANKVKHDYTTDRVELDFLKISELGIGSPSYVYDGIEGYVFPKTLPQPPNTVKLCRKYNPTTDDMILFAGTGPNGATCGDTDGATVCVGGSPCAALAGYTGTFDGTDFIGYVYPLAQAQPIYSGTAPVLPVPSIIANGSFELQNVGSGYSYCSMLDWSVGCGNWAGLSGNGSVLGTAPAPDGTQIAYMKALSFIQQGVSLEARQYVVSFKTAQRPGYTPLTLRVLVDGVEVGSYMAATTSFVTYTTQPFAIVTSGSHVLRIEAVGADTLSGFALIDDVKVQVN